MKISIYNSYGPIISDEESAKILASLNELLAKHKEKIEIDFANVIAMTTKSAKNIFGSLYLQLSPDGFYDRLAITNASSSIQEIIYDAILNNITNRAVNQ